MAIEEQKETTVEKVIPIKKISIKEFQMWLEGVEEMQEENWTPDPRQWKRIRAKIDAINSTLPATPATLAHPTGPVYRGNEGLPAGMEAIFPPMDGSVPTAASGPGVMPAPSALDAAAAPVGPAVPVNRPVTTASGMPVNLASGQPNIPVKTPDIDTSSGNGYVSSFS